MTAMINFLVFVDHQGKIQETQWCQPTDLILGKYFRLSELFDESSGHKVESFIETCCAVKSGICSEKQGMTLKNSSANLQLDGLYVDGQLLVFGVERTGSCPEMLENTMIGIVHSFMYTIKSYFENHIFYNDESIRQNFERIQLLNNELVNTRRKLEKANIQLNQANLVLNNRLVKDALTGLISRYQYVSEMSSLIDSQPGKMGVFVFLDIDNFKSVNDGYSHAAGDQYLIEFARRLKALPLEGVVAMRLSGDEFGLFHYGLETLADTVFSDIWKLIQDHVLYGPISIPPHELALSVSVGMAVYGRDTAEIFELIDYADFAMYSAKAAGKNQYCVFDRVSYDLSKGR